jgi:phosphatidylserine/phosphatidylglycerophosphate/cardiolipin synthase-like enzyme
VFDYRGGAADKVWVWTGSWNPTDPGTNDDKQNAIEIQDMALAGAFTAEFNEMWGSETDQPNASSSRFGGRKLDNTPHIFNIGGVQVECYFSPSDRTTSQIIRTLNKAEHSIYVGMLTLTRSDIAQTLVVKKNDGRRVRVVLNDSTATGTQYGILQSSGVDVRVLPQPGMMHHKYAVIDAERASGATAQYVITGSHNWTNAAENRNNENTLIIFDNRIANHYLQEFSARYQEAGGSQIVIVKVEDVAGSAPDMFWLGQNYPNPFNPATEINFSVGTRHVVSLRVYDILGREVITLVNEELNPGVYRVQWDARNMPSGVYVARMQAGGYSASRRMMLLK